MADGRQWLNLGWQDGKRRRKTYYGRTQREVQEKLAAGLRSHRQGLPLTSDRLTVGQYLNTWLIETAKPTIRPRTFQSYAEIVRLHLIPNVGKVPVGKLTPQNVQTLINSKLASGLSPRRVQYVHAVLRRALAKQRSGGWWPGTLQS